MIDKMNYRILINDIEIGYSELEHRDYGLGIFYGNFNPTSEYEKYRSIFHLYSEAMILRDKHEPYQEKFNEYVRKRDLLKITVEEEGGKKVPVSKVSIVDLFDELGSYEVEVWISKPDFINNHEISIH